MNNFYKIGFFVLLVGLIANSYYTYSVVDKLNNGFEMISDDYGTSISPYEVRVFKGLEGGSHFNYNNLGLHTINDGKPKMSFRVDNYHLNFQVKDSSQSASFRINPLEISQHIFCADSMVGFEYNCF